VLLVCVCGYVPDFLVHWKFQSASQGCANKPCWSHIVSVLLVKESPVHALVCVACCRAEFALCPALHAGTLIAQLSPHWGNILRVFDQLLETLKRNFVPAFLVKKLFQQLFSFVNVQLFNQLLLRRECCSFSNGEYVKVRLANPTPYSAENRVILTWASWVGLSKL